MLLVVRVAIGLGRLLRRRLDHDAVAVQSFPSSSCSLSKSKSQARRLRATRRGARDARHSSAVLTRGWTRGDGGWRVLGLAAARMVLPADEPTAADVAWLLSSSVPSAISRSDTSWTVLATAARPGQRGAEPKPGCGAALGEAGLTSSGTGRRGSSSSTATGLPALGPTRVRLRNGDGRTLHPRARTARTRQPARVYLYILCCRGAGRRGTHFYRHAALGGRLI
eukprot:86396-Chlamydomonas_euryale.AAC.14